MTFIARSTESYEDRALPRFNLRKRNASQDREPSVLPSVNSAFLSGLFADVAQVQMDKSEPPVSRPVKKSRVTMTRSISRNARSYKNLGDVLKSPTGVEHFFNGPKATLSKEDSLHFQLSCVSDSFNAGKLAFPQLPASVSNSSCNTLTRNLSDLQSSLSEAQDKETYGWFVDVDGESRETADPYANSSSLAFVAHTAPNATNQDDEVEWAKAADTVDDVLGDFF